MVHALTWVLATFLSPLKCQEPSMLSVEGSLGLNNILSYDIAAKMRKIASTSKVKKNTTWCFSQYGSKYQLLHGQLNLNGKIFNCNILE